MILLPNTGENIVHQLQDWMFTKLGFSILLPRKQDLQLIWDMEEQADDYTEVRCSGLLPFSKLYLKKQTKQAH